MFTVEKVAQSASYFLKNADGTSLPYLKLMKLLYIADRDAVKKLGYTISNDDHYSMKRGPILSNTYRLIMGSFDSESVQETWNKTIVRSSSQIYSVELASSVSELDLDELSRAELDILESVWRRFGQLDKYELVDWTHKNCPEWTDPGNSSTYISIVDIAKAVGMSEEVARSITEEMEERSNFERELAES